MPSGTGTDRSGQGAALANLSPRQAKAKGLRMSDTYGPISSGSSASVDLTLSLANKLQAKTEGIGSTVYQQTWKMKNTQSGRQYCQLVVSVLLTNEKGCSGWPTPTARDWKDTSNHPGRETTLGRLVHTWTGRPKRSHLMMGPEGTLNPALCRWLLGFPPEWDYAGDTAMRSCLK